MTPMDDGPALTTPWLTAAEAAAYLKRSKHFVLREIRRGRLRAATVGGRREIITRREWCDAWVEDQIKPTLLPIRRRS